MRDAHASETGTSSSSSSSEDEHEHSSGPMLDPSINVNALTDDGTGIRHEHLNPTDKKNKKNKSADVSKHTFYIENSQTRLKLYARNEVSHVLKRDLAVANTTFLLAPNAPMDRGF
jgi:hypothetical protein